MNIKNNKNCKITINDKEIAVSEKEKTANEINELDIFSYQERVIKEIVKKDDEYTKQAIKDYFIKNHTFINLKSIYTFYE